MQLFGKKPPEKLGSDLVVIKLFEIADRLADQAARGDLRGKQITVGTKWYTLEFAWIAATIFNDGDADIYIRLDDMSTLPWLEGEAPLKKGESLPLNLGARRYKPRSDPDDIVKPLSGGSPLLCLICQSGTATVRVIRLN